MTGFDMKSIDDLFGVDDAVSECIDIPLSKLDSFPNHPFKVIDNEDMEQLVESIKINGVINPAIVKESSNGRYFIISGHRRKRACELAGLRTLRCVVTNVSDDEAAVYMVDSNFQRSEILPSEKAFAYKMRLEAIKRQGRRTDLTSDLTGPKLRADEIISRNSNESSTQIKRYIRLTNLIPDLLELVDEGKIKLQPAVELSYINESNQKILFNVVNDSKKYPSMKQAEELRGYASVNNLTTETALEVLFGTPKVKKNNDIKIPYRRIKSFFPKDYTVDQIIEDIMEMLEDKMNERNY